MIVENAALGKERRFRGIEVFRLRILAHCPPAKGDHLALRIADGKHDPFAKTVIGRAIIAQPDQASLDQLGLFCAALDQRFAQRVRSARRKADAECLQRLCAQATALKVFTGIPRGGTAQLGAVKPLRRLHMVDQTIAFLTLFGGLRIALRQGHPGNPSQHFHGFVEGEVIHFHRKADGIAFFMTAEAIEKALAILDMKAGGFLAMKGTAGPIIALRTIRLAFVPFHTPPDNIGDREPGFQLFQILRRNGHTVLCGAAYRFGQWG